VTHRIAVSALHPEIAAADAFTTLRDFERDVMRIFGARDAAWTAVDDLHGCLIAFECEIEAGTPPPVLRRTVASKLCDAFGPDLRLEPERRRPVATVGI
jgi:hypothetical protein